MKGFFDVKPQSEGVRIKTNRDAPGLFNAAKPDYASNGSRRIMVSLRSGPVEMISTGTPVTSSMRLM
ncbi:hypothetical protein SMGES_02990 [Serratia marcescens]|nr:hypothetical protein SMGES_02990 [Serratia marcescens]